MAAYEGRVVDRVCRWVGGGQSDGCDWIDRTVERAAHRNGLVERWSMRSELS